MAVPDNFVTLELSRRVASRDVELLVSLIVPVDLYNLIKGGVDRAKPTYLVGRLDAACCMLAD